HNTCAPLNNNLAQCDAWLSTEIPKILASRAYSDNGAIFITWDEGEGSDGPIGMIVLSPLARGGGYFNNIHYTHSCLLRTLQEIFGIQPMFGDAVNARDLSDLFSAFAITRVSRAPDGIVQLTVSGVIPDRTNIVEISTNLGTW